MNAALRLTAPLLAALLGCSGPPPTPPSDLRPAADAAEAPADLSAPAPDLARLPDLAAPDLLPPPMLTGVPDCAPAVVSAATLFSQVFALRCTARYCHGTNDPIGNFSFDTAAKMRTVWVGKPSGQSRLPFIAAGNLDRSYVMWKLLGQQAQLTDPEMAGSRMPLPPLAPLPESEICLFINWIRSGAN